MELREAIYGRRSVRRYKADMISDEDMLAILEAGVMAPSAVNRQPWYFLVIKSPEKRKELDAIMTQVAQEFKPTLEKRFPDHPEVVQETTHFMNRLGGAPVVVLAFSNKPEKSMNAVLQSTAAAIENMLLTAYDRGIASCWLSSPLATSQKAVLEAKYGSGHGEIIAVVTFGYAETIPGTPKRRGDRFTII